MYSVLNYHDIAKRTEFYLGESLFNVTSNDNAGCLKNTSTTLKPYMILFRGHVQCFELS
jgi:hypothetical protein